MQGLHHIMDTSTALKGIKQKLKLGKCFMFLYAAFFPVNNPAVTISATTHYFNKKE